MSSGFESAKRYK